MIIDPPGSEPIAYMCPACGNYFCESAVQSYCSFVTAVFTDGEIESSYKSFWLTRCPRCSQYFAKKHLFKLPEPVPRRRPAHSSYGYMRAPIYEKTLGYVDRSWDYNETKLEFVEKAINKGQYFPVNVPEAERKRDCILLHKALWHQYNIDRDAVEDDTYIALCKKLIGLIEEAIVSDNLTLAELYRNIGDFEKSLTLLDGITVSEDKEKIVECIRDANIKKNTKTLKIILERHRK